MLGEIIKIIFYTLGTILGLVSLATIYALVRFGKSRTLGLLVSVIYAALMSALFISAIISLNQIPFENTF